MKIHRLSLLAVAIAVFSLPIFATDYTVDPTFNPTFQFSDFNADNSIGDVVVQPDGKIVVGGTFTQVNGETNYYIVRLNPDGTRDTTFNSGIIPSSGFLNYVRHVTLLPDGKFLVTGKFKINNQFSGYVKLNSDGSIDNSIIHYAFLSDINQRLIPLPDGKFLACGGRLINEEPYHLAYRMNPDGSPDTSFRVTFAQGSCTDLKLQPDGKILIAGAIHNGNNSYYEPLHRLNPDGSRDTTFNLQTTAAYGAIFSLLPNGKIVVTYGEGQVSRTTRFNSDGSRDIDFPNCLAEGFLPLANGDLLMNGCRKWATGHIFQFAIMRPDGTIDPSLDWINFRGIVNGFQGIVNGFTSAPEGKYFAYGNFTSVDGATRAKIVRLMPYQAPIKSKFDFDGDGKSDLAVFRPSDRYWYLHQSAEGPRYVQWGLSTDKPIAAHYDSDEKTDIAVYRDTDAVWHSMSSFWGYTWLTLGIRGKPLVGDFDADRKQDWVIRKVENGVVSWLVSTNSQHGQAFSTSNLTGELPGDVAIVGDFDGDSRDEVGYFRDGTWYTRDYGSGAPVRSFQWGAAGDIAVPEDYDGDGQDDYAVFRPSTGVWWINQSSGGYFIVHFGLNGDIPVPADYDGDGKVDIAIYRNGQWWQYRSNGGIVHVDQWGLAGDIPIPAQTQ